MKPPISPSSPSPVLKPTSWRHSSKLAMGRDFASRRDLAIIRLFIDTGIRRAELTALTVDDLDRHHRQATRHGQGSACPHRRVRPPPRPGARPLHPFPRGHREAHLPAFRLGLAGRSPTTASPAWSASERWTPGPRARTSTASASLKPERVRRDSDTAGKGQRRGRLQDCAYHQLRRSITTPRVPRSSPSASSFRRDMRYTTTRMTATAAGMSKMATSSLPSLLPWLSASNWRQLIERRFFPAALQGHACPASRETARG
jgi:integrase